MALMTAMPQMPLPASSLHIGRSAIPPMATTGYVYGLRRSHCKVSHRAPLAASALDAGREERRLRRDNPRAAGPGRSLRSACSTVCADTPRIASLPSRLPRLRRCHVAAVPTCTPSASELPEPISTSSLIRQRGRGSLTAQLPVSAPASCRKRRLNPAASRAAARRSHRPRWLLRPAHTSVYPLSQWRSVTAYSSKIFFIALHSVRPLQRIGIHVEDGVDDAAAVSGIAISCLHACPGDLTGQPHDADRRGACFQGLLIWVGGQRKQRVTAESWQPVPVMRPISRPARCG